MSQAHGKDMFNKGEKGHSDAMKAMQKLMNDPATMKKWMSEKKALFDSLPEQG